MDIKRRFKGCEWLSLVRDLLTLIFDADKDFELIIREYKERRSLNANNYSWVLTDKLAEKMLVAGVKLSKDEMHAEMIFRYGQPELNGDVVNIITTWGEAKLSDYYPYAKAIEQGTFREKDFTNWRVYRGSHTYSKVEMSLFIKGIVEECIEQGIETKTPDEIARLISLVKDDEYE